MLELLTYIAAGYLVAALTFWLAGRRGPLPEGAPVALILIAALWPLALLWAACSALLGGNHDDS